MLKLHRCAIKPRRGSERERESKQQIQANKSFTVMCSRFSFRYGIPKYILCWIGCWWARSVCIVFPFWCDRLCVYVCAINAFLCSNLVEKSVVTATAVAYVKTMPLRQGSVSTGNWNDAITHFRLWCSCIHVNKCWFVFACRPSLPPLGVPPWLFLFSDNDGLCSLSCDF